MNIYNDYGITKDPKKITEKNTDKNGFLFFFISMPYSEKNCMII